MHYADSMMNTPAGITMYDDFMNNPETEDTSTAAIAAFAYQATMYYYMSEYYTIHPHSCHDSVSICYNADFSLNQLSDNTLNGYCLYDGTRLTVSNFQTVTAMSPLPENKVPTDDYINGPLNSNQQYQFNFDPSNNASLWGIPNDTVRSNANYTSFELFDGGDDPKLPPGYLRRTPPSGRQSLRINNDHVQFHINRLEKRIHITPGDSIFYFSYAAVMQNPQPGAGGTHAENTQPFFIARLKDANGNFLEQLERVADYTKDYYQYYKPSSTAVPIVYNDWACHQFDLKPYADTNQVFTVEFIAADCGKGAHYGYAYVSFCENCGDLPTIDLDSTETGCLPSDFKFCGTFNVNDSIYDFVDIKIEVDFNDNTKEYVNVKPVDIDLVNGAFCFSLADIIKKMKEDTTCADVFAIMRVVNSNGDTITIRSTSIITNTQFDDHNDFCHDVATCCPTDTIEFEGNLKFVGNHDPNFYIFNLKNTIIKTDLTSGYYHVNPQHPIVTGGYITHFTITENATEYHLSGFLHITDTNYLSGTMAYLKYTNGTDTCDLVLKWNYSTVHTDECTDCIDIVQDVRRENIYNYLTGDLLYVKFTIDLFMPFNITASNCVISSYYVNVKWSDALLTILHNYTFTKNTYPYDSLHTIEFHISASDFDSKSVNAFLELHITDNCSYGLCKYVLGTGNNDGSDDDCDDVVVNFGEAEITGGANGTVKIPVQVTAHYGASKIDPKCEITTWYISLEWKDTFNVVHTYLSTSITSPTTTYLTSFVLSAADFGKMKSLRVKIYNNCGSPNSPCWYADIYLPDDPIDPNDCPNNANNGKGVDPLKGKKDEEKQEIQKSKVADEIRIYPNPVSHRMKVIWDEDIKPVTMQIIDSRNLVIQSTRLKNHSNNSIEQDISKLMDGIYRLVIIDRNGKVHSVSFIKN